MAQSAGGHGLPRASRDRAGELDKLIEHACPILGEGTVRLLRFHAGLPHQASL